MLVVLMMLHAAQRTLNCSIDYLVLLMVKTVVDKYILEKLIRRYTANPQFRPY